MTLPTKDQGLLAVVTGASSGIGYELAIELAKVGFNLLIIAENDAINESQIALSKIGPTVTALQVDLTADKGIQKVAEAVRASGQQLAVVALNAGIGASGEFVGGTSLATDLSLISLNVVATVALAKSLLPLLVSAGEGRVLFTSSVASLSPGPFSAVYHASKAFVRSFAEAVREELKGTGVTITSLMPGATETPFFARAHMLDTKIGQRKKDDPAEVAKQGIAALFKGEDQVVVDSLANRVQSAISKIVPDAFKAKQVRGETEPMTPGDEASVDAVTMLKEQHRDAEALFERIAKAQAGEGEAIFKTLATKLLLHMMIEEDVFYPAAAKINHPEAFHAAQEHEEAKALIAQALRTSQSSEDFLASVHALRQAITAHVQFEETQLFPHCQAVLDKDDLIDLADEMRDLTVEIEAQGAMWVHKTPRRSRRNTASGTSPAPA